MTFERQTFQCGQNSVKPRDLFGVAGWGDVIEAVFVGE